MHLLQKPFNTVRRVALSIVLLAAIPTIAEPPRLASEFVLSGANGKPLRMSDYRGQVVLINFMASWCGPCRQEMPILDRIHQRYRSLGFTVIGVDVDQHAADGAKMLSNVPVSFPVGFDPEGMVSTVYSVDSMPCTVIVDRKGNIRHLHRGYKPGTEDEYVEQIKLLVKE